MAEIECLFQQIYDRYGRSLYRFCLIHMQNSSDAEDMVQEVFIKRLYGAPEFQTPEHERRWMFRVAANLCRDELKHKRRTDLPLADMPDIQAAPESPDLPERLAALPAKQKTVIHLHYYEGYSAREIASILGISVSAVKMRLKRGRDALRNELEGEL